MFEQLPLTLTIAQTDPGGGDPAPGPTGDSGGTATVGQDSGAGNGNTAAPTGADAGPGPAVGPGPDAAPGIEGQPSGPAATQPGKPPSLLEGFGLPAMILLLLVFMFGMNMLTQRKEKKKRQDMLSALKKNDRVVTVGGVIGTVVEVKSNEVTLKVDESSNTRMKFTRSAIQGVVDDETGE